MHSPIFPSKAVIVLCARMKWPGVDHLTNYVYDRRMIDARRLAEAIAETRKSPEPMRLPEYTFDVHTRKGRAKGKTKADFFKDELAALNPRQIGLFDDLVTPPAA